jgi:hypothetical protein
LGKQGIGKRTRESAGNHFFLSAIISARGQVFVYLGNAQHDQFGLGIGHVTRNFARLGRKHAATAAISVFELAGFMMWSALITAATANWTVSAPRKMTLFGTVLVAQTMVEDGRRQVRTL